MEKRKSQLGRTHEGTRFYPLQDYWMDFIFCLSGGERHRWRNSLVCSNGCSRMIMRKILIYYFIFSFVVGACIYVLQKMPISLPKLINNYLNDFLIVPIVLAPCLYILRWSKNNPKYELSLAIILYVCSMFSLLFEWYFPKILSRYTADILDVMIYFLSGIFFYVIQKLSLEAKYK